MTRSLISILMVSFAAVMSLLPAPAAARGPLILAAASLQESMNDAADAWAAKGHERPVISYAGTSALARQIKAGAPADLFVSADRVWMDNVQKAGLLRKGSRRDLLGNRLVLVVPRSSDLCVPIVPRFPLAKMLGKKRLAMANPDGVPAGKYGKAALQKLGVWDSVRTKVARTENVRAALALVERRAAPYGIVYSTDALASKKVRVAGIFPLNTHPPIVYPMAMLKSSTNREAVAFWRFLQSREARKLFSARGFTAP